MSETAFAATRVAPLPYEPEAEPTKGRRKIAVLGGVCVAVIFGVGGYLLLNPGSSAGDDQYRLAPPTTAPSAVAVPAKPDKPVVVRPATVQGRDPLKPLFDSGSSGTATSTGTSSGTTSGTATGASAGSASSSAASMTLAVSAIDVTAQTASISVDGKKYVAAVGKPFGQYFTVYSVFNDQCVGVLYGDQSIPVCTTQSQSVTP